MGTIADSMINGETCSHCGVMFIEPHGHEVLCEDCFDSESEEERAGIPCATLEEL